MTLAIVIKFGVVTGIFIAADRMITGEGSPGTFEITAPPKADRSMVDRIAESLIGRDNGDPAQSDTWSRWLASRSSRSWASSSAFVAP